MMTENNVYRQLGNTKEINNTDKNLLRKAEKHIKEIG